VTEDWQEATYYFINAAPQWQSINNGNWKDVEYTVRKLADRTGRDFQVSHSSVISLMCNSFLTCEVYNGLLV
jgi:DNA/RNA endonuclease G (NUC1)